MRPDAALFLGFIWSQFVATIWQRQQCSTNDPPRPLDSRRRPLYRPPLPPPVPPPAPESLLIVPFASHVPHLIAPRLRDPALFTVLFPFSGPSPPPPPSPPTALFLSRFPAPF